MFSPSLFIRRFPLFRPIRRFLYTHSYVGLEKEALGFQLRNPVGAAGTAIPDGSRIIGALSDFGYGFIEVDGSLDSIQDLREGESAVPVFACIPVSCDNRTEEEVISSTDRLFSKLYDFADAFIIARNPLDPNPLLDDEMFVSDLLDNILSTRLSEETYKPVLLKVFCDTERGRLESLLSYCRLSGIDGIVVESDSSESAVKMLTQIVKMVSGRYPVIVSAPFSSAEEASDALEKGASLLLLKPVRGNIIPRPKTFLRYLEND